MIQRSAGRPPAEAPPAHFPARARRAIDRYVGRDSLTVRRSQRRAAQVLAELTAADVADADHYRYHARGRSRNGGRLAVPSVALSVLP